MTVQSEYQLENELIAQLQGLGYATVTIKDERQLLSNLKTQIERANGLAPLSETEWKQVISFSNTGTVFERAKNLRDQFPVKFDDGSSKHIFFYQMTQAKTYIRSPIKSPSTTATIMANQPF
jgi:type I restriction enzyme R subunit